MPARTTLDARKQPQSKQASSTQRVLQLHVIVTRKHGKTLHTPNLACLPLNFETEVVGDSILVQVETRFEGTSKRNIAVLGPKLGNSLLNLRSEVFDETPGSCSESVNTG